MDNELVKIFTRCKQLREQRNYIELKQIFNDAKLVLKGKTHIENIEKSHFVLRYVLLFYNVMACSS